MQKRLIKIGSITYALKVKRALSDLGIKTKVLKTSSEANGCIYSLEVPDEKLFSVISEIKKLGISYEFADIEK